MPGKYSMSKRFRYFAEAKGFAGTKNCRMSKFGGSLGRGKTRRGFVAAFSRYKTYNTVKIVQMEKKLEGLIDTAWLYGIKRIVQKPG